MMRGAKTFNGVHCIKEDKQTQTVENTPLMYQDLVTN